MQGRKGVFNSLCHCVYLCLLGDVLATGNGIDGGFHAGEVLVVVLVQCVCLGNGCVNLCIISILVLQGSDGFFDILRHGIHCALFSDILVTDNGIDSGFHSGEVLVVVLVQCICLGDGCIDLGVVGILVLQGSNGIFDSFRHCINFALFSDVLATDNSIDGSFYRSEVFVLILVQSVYLADGCIDSCVISGNVIGIPHKSRMSNPGYPLYIASCICLKSYENIVRVKVVGSGSG